MMERENYVRHVLELFAGYGDAEAIVADDRRVTFRELHDGILGIASQFNPGVAVGVLASTAPEAVMLQFAVHLLGGRIAWIAPNAPRSFQDSFLVRAGADVFVYDEHAAGALGSEMAGASGLPTYRLHELAAHAPAGLPEGVTTEPQALYQTSGTTGDPKLVLHGEKFFNTALAFARHYKASGEHAMKHLSLAGYWVMSTQMPAHMAMLTGGTYYTVSKFVTAEFFGLIAKERITDTLLTPPLLYFLLDHPLTAEADCTSLRRVNVGGAPVAASRLQQAIERFGPVMRPAYGMSEAPIIAAYPGIPADPVVLGSVGQPYGDLQLEVRSPEGQQLPAGEPGEVWLRGGVMMSGYWGQPELTAETIVDGWLRTGDFGYVAPDGNLFLLDRVKDMILTGWGSTNVYARPVEDALAAHPAVHAAAVVGVPSAEFGEVVHAYVVPAAGASATPEELREFVAGRLNGTWAPREVEFVAELPLTGTGKVDKKQLRAWRAASQEAGKDSTPAA
ncbi:class I adenylate-forming enzyme family protein [Longispora albida]|uniref:class I adenylate-forming enzyme family protein n=1 Tax=Longispora albida TaxID=203523 RepID=UPI000365E5B4|nr:AMP-binding protein [Longispora albida]